MVVQWLKDLKSGTRPALNSCSQRPSNQTLCPCSQWLWQHQLLYTGMRIFLQKHNFKNYCMNFAWFRGSQWLDRGSVPMVVDYLDKYGKFWWPRTDFKGTIRGKNKIWGYLKLTFLVRVDLRCLYYRKKSLVWKHVYRRRIQNWPVWGAESDTAQVIKSAEFLLDLLSWLCST